QAISIARLELSDRTGRFAGRNEGRGDLPLCKLVECVGRPEVDFLDVDVEAGENVPSGHLAAAALGVEVHLAAAQLFERGDVRAGHDMNFIVGNLRDIDELVLEIAELAAAPKMAEDVADRESEIDPAQEANVTNE